MINPGDTVYSKPDGARKGFWGRVTLRGPNHYHVMNFADGTQWHRVRADLLTESEYAEKAGEAA